MVPVIENKHIFFLCSHLNVCWIKEWMNEWTNYISEKYIKILVEVKGHVSWRKVRSPSVKRHGFCLWLCRSLSMWPGLLPEVFLLNFCDPPVLILKLLFLKSYNFLGDMYYLSFLFYAISLRESHYQLFYSNIYFFLIYIFIPDSMAMIH